MKSAKHRSDRKHHRTTNGRTSHKRHVPKARHNKDQEKTGELHELKHKLRADHP